MKLHVYLVLIVAFLIGSSPVLAAHPGEVETEVELETTTQEAKPSPLHEEGAHEEETTDGHEETSSSGSTVASVGSSSLIGTRGEAVNRLQVALIAAGLLALDAPTGYFGPLTAAAVGNLPALAPVAHGHEMIDVSEWSQVPSVSAKLHEDAMAGFNLEVKVRNFEFAPQNVNGAVEENEGHAHVYVNGVKYARLYGTWMHLPASLFRDGENDVRVTLNANDHSDLARDGESIAATVTAHVH
jgi:hypothetical protein